MKIRSAVEQISNIFFKEHEGASYHLLLRDFEKALFRKLLEYTEGNQLKAARILGINRNTLRSKLRKLKLRR